MNGSLDYNPLKYNRFFYPHLVQYLCLVTFFVGIFTIIIININTHSIESTLRIQLTVQQMISSSVDIVTGILVQPLMCIPFFSIFPIGFLKNTTDMDPFLQVTIMVTVMYMQYAGTIIPFFCRHQALLAPTSRIKIHSKTKIHIISTLLYLLIGILTPVFMLQSKSNQTTARNMLYKNQPMSHEMLELYGPSVFVFVNNFNFSILIVYLFILTTLVQVFMIYFTYQCRLEMNRNSLFVSERTKLLGKKLTEALVTQQLFSTFYIFVPTMYLLVTYFVDHVLKSSQDANNVCIFVFAIHGGISATLKLIIHPAYRTFIWDRIIRKKRNEVGNNSELKDFTDTTRFSRK